jgi:hypothetical protein
MLQTCRHTVAGTALSRGLSGGQAKRANIGLALVTKPRVMFLVGDVGGGKGQGQGGEKGRASWVGLHAWVECMESSVNSFHSMPFGGDY